MKSALLSQNDNTVIENLKQNVGRSVFDLSHSTTFPIDVNGAILPICCIETVPSDSFEISVECLLRQLSPLKVPPMARFQLNTAFFYCDNRLAWKKWDRFMTGGRSGNETYDIPKMANIQSVSGGKTKRSVCDVSPTSGYFKNINYQTALHTYFGISMNRDFSTLPNFENFPDDSEECPVAFPFFDYQMICRDFYTDIDRLPNEPKDGNDYYNFNDINSDWAYSNLFPPDDDEIRLTDGYNYKSGFQSGDDLIQNSHGFILDKVRYHNVRDDYFTTSKKAPMRGDVPTIDTTVAVSNIDFSTAFNNKTSQPSTTSTIMGIMPSQDNPLDPDSEWRLSNYNIQNVPQTTNQNFTVETNPNLNKYVINALNKAQIELETVKSINAAELRLLSQLTVWQELNMLHKPYYQDFLNAHFDGVRVGESAVEKPIYIGGTSQNIAINEILQTSATSETSPLGTQGATAMSLANNYVGKIYCNNYGYIIGVAYIITDMYYNPAMPRGFSRRTKEEYYSPEFANLSMQAILNKEIFFSNDDEWNNTPWGYTGIFDELRSVPNKVAGDLLNENYQDLKKWVIRREFTNDNKPAMNSTFLTLKDNVDKSNWSVQSMPAFMLQCANYIKAVRPMPYLAIPKAL